MDNPSAEVSPVLEMALEVSIVAPNKRRKLLAPSQKLFPLGSLNQHDIAVEASTTKEQAMISENELLTPWHKSVPHKTILATAGKVSQASTQVPSCEHNRAASAQGQWQSGHVAIPGSISNHATMSVKLSKSSFRQKLKSVFLTKGLVLFEKERPAAPGNGCESAHRANQTPKQQEKKHGLQSKATQKWGKLVEKIKLLKKHKACFFQTSCNRMLAECPVKSRKVLHNSGRRDRALCKMKAICDSGGACKPVSFTMANFQEHCDGAIHAVLPDVLVASLRACHEKEFPNCGTKRTQDSDAAFAYTPRRILFNVSQTDESKTLVAAEDFGDFLKPDLATVSESEVELSETEASSKKALHGVGPGGLTVESSSLVIYRPVRSFAVIAQSRAPSNRCESRLVPVTSGNRPFLASPKGRLENVTENRLILCSEKILFREFMEQVLTQVPLETVASLAKYSDLTRGIFCPVVHKEDRALQREDPSKTRGNHHGSISNQLAIANYHSARLELAEATPQASEIVKRSCQQWNQPRTKLECWVRAPKGHLWVTLGMEAILLPKLDRNTFKLTFLDADLNILCPTAIEQTLSQYLARMRLLVNYKPNEFNRFDDLEYSGVEVTPAPQFKGVSELDLYLSLYYSPKKNTGPLSSLLDRVRFEDAMMTQCKQWLLVHYDFQGQLEAYLLSLLRKVQLTGDAFVKVCTDMASDLRDEGFDFDYDNFLDDYLDDFWYFTDSSVTYLEFLDCYFKDTSGHAHSDTFPDPSKQQPRPGQPNFLLDHYEERLLGIMEDLEALEEMEQSINNSIGSTLIGYKLTLVNIFRGYQKAYGVKRRYRHEFHEAWKQMEGNAALSDQDLNRVLDCVSLASQESFLDECINLGAGKALDIKMHRAQVLCHNVSNALTSLRLTYNEVTLRFLDIVYAPQGLLHNE